MQTQARTALAHQIAESILDGFNLYRNEFNAITRQARDRFETRDWHGMQADVVARLDVHGRNVLALVGRIQALLGQDLWDHSLWELGKASFSRLIADFSTAELAETFFNSVTRRVFATVGVDARIEFVQSRPEEILGDQTSQSFTTFTASGLTARLVEEILAHHPFSAPFEDSVRDSARAADLIEKQCEAQWGAGTFSQIDVLDSVFFRGQGAYVIGRVRNGQRVFPLVIAFRNLDSGIRVDAVLLTEDEASIVFSFTRSYFHVDVEQPAPLVHFLRSIMPKKRVAELYTALGLDKHGKTELYRDLLRHSRRSTDRFEVAPGDPGMVMVVFTMPSYDVVFKVIRDRFPPPKRTTRSQVMEKYDLVFKHDRAGRLVDTQEFEHLTFNLDRFSEELVEELRISAGESVTVSDNVMDIRHLYIERRLTPLNLYIREAGSEAVRAAILDYGQAIKDLAASNIFPGDLLTKNFGVTRHGRVVFYDYDELCLLGACNFRDLPQPRDDFETMQSEPWYYVGPDDIFPEEFRSFLGLPAHLVELFVSHHKEIFDPAWWRGIQAHHKAGGLIEIAPYAAKRRLFDD